MLSWLRVTVDIKLDVGSAIRWTAFLIWVLSA